VRVSALHRPDADEVGWLAALATAASRAALKLEARGPVVTFRKQRKRSATNTVRHAQRRAARHVSVAGGVYSLKPYARPRPRPALTLKEKE
jgi:hypothetical protein